MKHWNIKITGRVQGVFFRASTKAVADQLGVKGFVTNMSDGSVYMEVEGDKFGLESMLEFCHEGPEHAEVTKVEFEQTDDLKGFQNFNVIKKIK